MLTGTGEGGTVVEDPVSYSLLLPPRSSSTQMEGAPGQQQAPPCTSASPLRVFFFAFFATGNILPMADLARRLAARGLDCTLVLTAANAALVRPAIDRAAGNGLPIRLLTFPFPAAAAGLLEGVENLATAPPSEVGKLHAAVVLSEPARRRILLEHRPDAVVADWWITGLDRGLGIPWVTFRPIGAFPTCVIRSLAEHRPHDALAEGDNGRFVVPGLPDPVEIVKSELPEFLRIAHNLLNDNMEQMNQVEREGCGSIVNSFYELEPAYADLCRRGDPGHGWWFVGPLALGCGDNEEAEEEGRGGDAGSNAERCMAWLGTQPPASVVYVCFGSWCHFTGEQLREMAAGLDSSGCAFLWVVREAEHLSRWLPEGFERRLAGRGLVVRGWAPQVAVLGHPAVGAFVTHCGWNSLLEGVSAGLPMITWPLVFEQFINERLVVELLRVGVRMHGGFRSSLREEAARAVVKAEAIAEVVGRFAPEVRDGEVEEMRRRAGEYARMARAAVREGGSSYNDVDRLVEHLRSCSGKQQGVQ